MASKRNLKDMLKQAYQEYDNLEVVLNKDETIVLQTIALLVDKTPKKIN